MVIADRNTVRKLAGNRRPELLPDADIDSAIAFSDSFVQTSTNKFDWTDGTDPAYETLKQASEYFAASEILGRFQDKEEESKNEWERGEKLLLAIKENFASATGDEDPGSVVNIVRGSYRTAPLNPLAPYRRAYGKGEVAPELWDMVSRYP
jgi:hypothetical protein